MSLSNVSNSIESKWEALDIFLFCNGQNTTPPRKYHLKSEDFQKWNDTLMRIAQSHYGVEQSIIDLYTTDGEKLITPTEIMNNNVYVAVPRTEKFIPAGYNEYLLKASRSREKRQGKISISKDETVDKKTNKISVCDGSKNKSNNITDDQAKSPMENQSMIQPKRNPSNKMLEQNVTRKSFHFPFQKKYSRNVPANTVNKDSFKNKEDSLRKKKLMSNGNFNKKPISFINPNSSIKLNGKVSNKYNSMAKDTKSNNKNPNISKKIQNTSRISDEDSITTDNPVINDFICDKDLIVVKPESISIDINTGISLLSRPNETLSEISTLSRLDENVTNKEETFEKDNCYNDENNRVQNVTICNVQSSTHHNVFNKNTYTNTIEYKYPTEKPNINNDSQSTENFIAVVDEGDIINFNIKLKLKKCDEIVKADTDNKIQFMIENNYKSDVTKERSILRAGKTSKVMVMRCPCCCRDDFGEISHICEPSDTIEKRCNCEQEGARAVPLEIELDKIRSSISNPVTKVNADTSLIKMTDKHNIVNEPEIDIKINDINMNISQKQLLPQSKPKEDPEEVSNNLTKDENTIKADLNFIQSYNIERNKDPESLILRINASDRTKRFIDNSTQTEWASLLLEAKRHEDGKYSFHLPPLSVLKYYFR